MLRLKNDLALRPKRHLAQISQKYPTAWKYFEEVLLEKKKGVYPSWPDWCFCPLAASYALVSGGKKCTMENIGDVAVLGGLAAWRITQGVYRFHPELFSELVKTGLNGDVPVDVLLRLPEWCVYLDLSLAGDGDEDSPFFGAAGCFAFLEFDIKNGRKELRLLFDVDDVLTGKPTLIPVILHIETGSVEDALAAARKTSLKYAAEVGVPAGDLIDRQTVQLFAELATPTLSLLLYLCAETVDYADGQAPTSRKRRLFTKTRKGLRVFPPSGPQFWDVGVRLGPALGAARKRIEAEEVKGRSRDHQPGSRALPRGHIRKAHWHGYWTGPKSSPDKRKVVLKWLPPIPVKISDYDKLPVVVHKVD